MLRSLHLLTQLSAWGSPSSLAQLTRGFAVPALNYPNLEDVPTAALLSTVIPDHVIEEGLPVVQARLRSRTGTKDAIRMRKTGRLPGLLDSLPGKDVSLLIDMDMKEAAALVRKFGRNGIQSRVMQLDIYDEQSQPVKSVRMLPRLVHINSRTLTLENLTFLFCPRDRVLKAPIPVKLWNTEVAPGVKKGGWLHTVSRTVMLKCEGWAIPPQLELDMRSMELHDILRFRDLQLPAGTSLAVPDPSQAVVRCAAKLGGGD